MRQSILRDVGVVHTASVVGRMQVCNYGHKDTLQRSMNLPLVHSRSNRLVLLIKRMPKTPGGRGAGVAGGADAHPDDAQRRTQVVVVGSGRRMWNIGRPE